MTVHASRLLACALPALLACGSRASAPSTPAPDYRPVDAEPAPPNAKLYAACLADATANDRYQRAHDPDTSLLLFTCTGEPARAFFDGLAAWSARIGSQFEHAGRTFRSTARVQENLFGVDYCATDGTTHECVITLNVGDFVQ